MTRLSVMLVAIMLVGSVVPVASALEVDEDPICEFNVGHFTAVLGEDPIFKLLVFEEDKNGDGYVDLADVSLFLENCPLKLYEDVEIDERSASWSDWHEEILSPNWVWTGASFSAPGLSGLSVEGIGTPVLDFYFDPLPPGMVIDIDKTLEYTGDVMDLFPSFGGQPIPGAVVIEVMEYPTPEPATCSLILIAGLCFAFRRCRRRR